MSRTPAELWSAGYGPIAHTPETVERIRELAGRAGLEDATLFAQLTAADHLTCAAMWTIAHMTYASRVDLSGAPLPRDAFKPDPQGHTGGSLNMAPAFVGYLLANALSGHTRAWLMGQGHCVAAIEAVNTLTGDVSVRQRGRYDRSEAGLTRLVSDFYSYAIDPSGRPGVPLGSHAGPDTAGAVSEGGYLGFAGLQYVHMPLPGERLVAFLSDGAFEEQRGSDWSPRWWRAEDCGLAVPVMILNGRRIEERTQIAQEGGAEWFAADLAHNGFDPILIDGRDPAAFAWAILEAEARLEAFAADPDRRYPARLPYIIAETEKGFGFPGADANEAHNLPLKANPFEDAEALAAFNAGAAKLFVPADRLEQAVAALATHEAQARPLESRHPLAARHPSDPALPEPEWCSLTDKPSSAMQALDAWFVRFVDANPDLRVRIGNPDELRSNKMGATLDRLKHRVNQPEPGIAEAVDGAVITALNEEAVAAAALGNKGGLNLIVSYEAFAMKMLGLLRQEIIFARRQKEVGAAPGWLSVPVLASSHVWENAKNEQSHQDPTLGEALLGEMSDTARVLFPVDANSAVACLKAVYAGRGQIACLVAPKKPLPQRLDAAAAQALAADGAAHVKGEAGTAQVQLVAIGAYQLVEVLTAADRLKARGFTPLVTALVEPGRFRSPRDQIEAQFTAHDETVEALFPRALPRVLACHTRPEPMLGALRRLDAGPGRTAALGYINRGGTLDVPGLLFANRCSWAHLVEAAATLLQIPAEDVLSAEEIAALSGRGDPSVIMKPDG
jgi:phosphoketolase